MKLYNLTGESCELQVIGYQFANQAQIDNIWDLNWLIILIRVQHSQGFWEAQQPCLLTKEVLALRNWLMSILEKKPTQRTLEFIEPHLVFQYQSLSQTLRLFFETGFRPSWMPWDGIMQDLWIDVPIEGSSIKNCIYKLDQYLHAYPPRDYQGQLETFLQR